MLRARSDGPRPSALVLAVAFVAVVALVRPLTSRERGLRLVVGGLLAIQIALHAAFLYASTGELAHAGSAGFFCRSNSHAVVSRAGVGACGHALAAAANEGKFEALREALFAHQPHEHTGGYTTADLLRLGASVGLTDRAYADDVRSMTDARWVA